MSELSSWQMIVGNLLRQDPEAGLYLQLRFVHIPALHSQSFRLRAGSCTVSRLPGDALVL